MGDMDVKLELWRLGLRGPCLHHLTAVCLPLSSADPERFAALLADYAARARGARRRSGLLSTVMTDADVLETWEMLGRVRALGAHGAPAEPELSADQAWPLVQAIYRECHTQAEMALRAPPGIAQAVQSLGGWGELIGMGPFEVEAMRKRFVAAWGSG